MSKIEKSLPSVLSPEDKKFLRSYSRYLNTNGLKDANIEIDFEPGYELSDIKWNTIDSLSNDFRVEVFSELVEILKKISDFCDQKGLITVDEDTSYERIDVNIDTKTQEISFQHYYSWYSTGDGVSTVWSAKEDEDTIEVFDILQDTEISQGESILTLDFNGSGDSGYIEDFFSNRSSVPAPVEDWCYSSLEHMHGGWEINEGSQGSFIFDLKNKEITLYFAENYQEDSSNTFFEESFAK